MPKSELYMGRMKHVVKYDTTVVDRFEDIEEDILKVSVCDMSGIDHSKEYFMNKWQNQAAVAISGDMYMDFTDLKASKGSAMKHIQEAFGISPDECMAFGDNYNDIQMLDSVIHSYAMENAVDDVKKHANHTTAWVEGTLKRIFL